jgi:hypothetical protein
VNYTSFLGIILTIFGDGLGIWIRLIIERYWAQLKNFEVSKIIPSLYSLHYVDEEFIY